MRTFEYGVCGSIGILAVLALIGAPGCVAIDDDASDLTGQHPEDRAAADRTGGRGAPKSTTCAGTWTLTCSTPDTCDDITADGAGYVSGTDVYWAAHTPTGPWVTRGADGRFAFWMASGGCPDYVVVPPQLGAPQIEFTIVITSAP